MILNFLCALLGVGVVFVSAVPTGASVQPDGTLPEASNRHNTANFIFRFDSYCIPDDLIAIATRQLRRNCGEWLHIGHFGGPDHIKHKSSPITSEKRPLTDFVVFYVSLPAMAAQQGYGADRLSACATIAHEPPHNSHHGLCEAAIVDVVREQQYTRRTLLAHEQGKNEIVKPPVRLGASQAWGAGTRGRGVKVALFDTGIAVNRQLHFAASTIAVCLNYTSQPTCQDGFGHGTFVAGTIASHFSECPGIAPDATLFIFKVFTDAQVSYTSWFLDAFNAALQFGVDVINLSIGGPDYFDRPFVDKVNEVTSAGITVVTAVGNDGPVHGTVFNPADQLDVLGVGAHNDRLELAAFSSRGMTTWELPCGFGRPKPDIVTYGENLYGASMSGHCRTLSGTSVASPVVVGGLVLVVSILKERGLTPNPAMLKQIALETAKLLPLRERSGKHNGNSDGDTRTLDSSIFAQGAGAFSLVDALQEARKYAPHLSLHPSRLLLRSDNDAYSRERDKECAQADDTSRCRRGWCYYLWPYCARPLYFSGQPLIVNATLLNPFSVVGEVVGWEVHLTGTCGHNTLGVRVDTSAPLLWPWVGSVVFTFSVLHDVQGDLGCQGSVEITVAVQPGGSFGVSMRNESVTLPFDVLVVPCPPRSSRVLWDVYHQIQYPPAYVPRDALDVVVDLLDWRGDHPYTNFAVTYLYMTQTLSLNVEILSSDFTAFNASDYAVLLLVDTEEFFLPTEISKLHDDVSKKGLSVVLFSDWYNTAAMEHIAFVDDNTNEMWKPVTGGANVPALNALLRDFEIELSASMFSGDVMLDATRQRPQDTFQMRSGGSIHRLPGGGRTGNSVYCTSALQMIDALRQLSGKGARDIKMRSGVPIIGLVQVGREADGSELSGHKMNMLAENGTVAGGGGRIAIYTDSNCLDTTHLARGRYCHDLLRSMIEFCTTGDWRAGVLQKARCTKVVSSGLPLMDGSEAAEPLSLANSNPLSHDSRIFPYLALGANSSAVTCSRAERLNVHSDGDETAKSHYVLPRGHKTMLRGGVESASREANKKVRRWGNNNTALGGLKMLFPSAGPGEKLVQQPAILSLALLGACLLLYVMRRRTARAWRVHRRALGGIH